MSCASAVLLVFATSPLLVELRLHLKQQAQEWYLCPSDATATADGSHLRSTALDRFFFSLALSTLCAAVTHDPNCIPFFSSSAPLACVQPRRLIFCKLLVIPHIALGGNVGSYTFFSLIPLGLGGGIHPLGAPCPLHYTARETLLNERAKHSIFSRPGATLLSSRISQHLSTPPVLPSVHSCWSGRSPCCIPGDDYARTAGRLR